MREHFYFLKEKDFWTQIGSNFVSLLINGVLSSFLNVLCTFLFEVNKEILIMCLVSSNILALTISTYHSFESGNNKPKFIVGIAIVLLSLIVSLFCVLKNKEIYNFDIKLIRCLFIIDCVLLLFYFLLHNIQFKLLNKKHARKQSAKFNLNSMNNNNGKYHI